MEISARVYRPRRAQESPLFRLVAHVLIRLLIVGPLPDHLQAAAALFPVSVLRPLALGCGAAGTADREHGRAEPDLATGYLKLPRETMRFIRAKALSMRSSAVITCRSSRCASGTRG